MWVLGNEFGLWEEQKIFLIIELSFQLSSRDVHRLINEKLDQTNKKKVKMIRLNTGGWKGLSMSVCPGQREEAYRPKCLTGSVKIPVLATYFKPN
jgi:hypothetical protein